MMDAFRNFGQSWVAKILMILIALSFVLWGVSGYLFWELKFIGRSDGGWPEN